MKTINTSNGYTFSVDEQDFENVSKWKWIVIKKHNVFYVVRNVYIGGGRSNKKYKRLYLHRFLFGNDCDGKIVDHLDGNGLNNSRSNLRIVSHQQNLRNREGCQSNSKSGYRGVYWHKQREKWAASIRHNGKNISLGLYKNIYDAVNARNKKQNELWSDQDNFRDKSMIEAAQGEGHE